MFQKDVLLFSSCCGNQPFLAVLQPVERLNLEAPISAVNVKVKKPRMHLELCPMQSGIPSARVLLFLFTCVVCGGGGSSFLTWIPQRLRICMSSNCASVSPVWFRARGCFQAPAYEIFMVAWWDWPLGKERAVRVRRSEHCVFWSSSLALPQPPFVYSDERRKRQHARVTPPPPLPLASQTTKITTTKKKHWHFFCRYLFLMFGMEEDREDHMLVCRILSACYWFNIAAALLCCVYGWWSEHSAMAKKKWRCGDGGL